MPAPVLQRAGNSAYNDAATVYTHIADPNERRRMALAEVDKAPFGWYHIRLAVVTGIGFFTDAYSLFAINLTVILLGIVYWQDEINKGVMPHNADTAIKVATSAGAIFGQVFFGYLADVLGRKQMYGVELMIIILTTLAQSLCGDSKAVSIIGVLVFYRVVMGIGVGGDYALSAVITAEFASTKHRGGIMAAVFAMQGFGQLAASLVSIVLISIFKDALVSVPDIASCSGDCVIAVDRMWRILVAFGGVPGWFALYYRLTIPETPRYTFDVLYDVEKASVDTRRYRYGKTRNAIDPVDHAHVRRDMGKYKTPRPTVGEIIRFYSTKSNAIKLFGTAFSWFFLDLAFYGISFSSPSLLSTMGFDKRDNLYVALRSTAIGQVVLICAGAIPGYWMTVFAIDRVGRKPIQLGGFAILTVVFCVLGFGWKSLTKVHLLVLYVLAQFFFNFGPNATTFITPAEVFPTRVRSTGHGLSAGFGKFGAIIAQVFFAPMIKRGATHENPTPWIHGVMQIFALFMFLGCLTSLLVPETKGASLEDLAEEPDVRYELQFRSRFYSGGTGTSREGRGKGKFTGGLGMGMKERNGVGKGVGRGGGGGADHKKGRWWKLG